MERTIHYHLHIKAIHCHIPDEADADEVYLKLDGKKIWPSAKYQSMQSGREEVELEYLVEKGGVHTIEVWDHDNFSRNDLLGTLKVDTSSSGGPYMGEVKPHKGSQSRYSIEYEIL